jgi:hypothetical protein
VSNLIHSIQKKIKTPSMVFPVEMYNNIIGSLVICAFIFGNDKTKETISKITKTWNEFIKNPEKAGSIDFSKQDEIDGALKLFGMTRPDIFSIAFVQSPYNALFAPYVEGKVLPIREDGFIGITLRTGKIYPVIFDADKKSN